MSRSIEDIAYITSQNGEKLFAIPEVENLSMGQFTQFRRELAKNIQAKKILSVIIDFYEDYHDHTDLPLTNKRLDSFYKRFQDDRHDNTSVMLYDFTPTEGEEGLNSPLGEDTFLPLMRLLNFISQLSVVELNLVTKINSIGVKDYYEDILIIVLSRSYTNLNRAIECSNHDYLELSRGCQPILFTLNSEVYYIL